MKKIIIFLAIFILSSIVLFAQGIDSIDTFHLSKLSKVPFYFLFCVFCFLSFLLGIESFRYRKDIKNARNIQFANVPIIHYLIFGSGILGGIILSEPIVPLYVIPFVFLTAIIVENKAFLIFIPVYFMRIGICGHWVLSLIGLMLFVMGIVSRLLYERNHRALILEE